MNCVGGGRQGAKGLHSARGILKDSQVKNAPRAGLLTLGRAGKSPRWGAGGFVAVKILVR